jgi:hypothetical protein
MQEMLGCPHGGCCENEEAVVITEAAKKGFTMLCQKCNQDLICDFEICCGVTGRWA